MVSKNQWRAIAIVLAVVLLLAAFMTGLTGIADGISPVGEVRDDYASFKKELDALSDNEKALADGKADDGIVAMAAGLRADCTACLVLVDGLMQEGVRCE